jgi:alcohol dehydrogenase YqhD (iron-dependent ADH family)
MENFTFYNPTKLIFGKNTIPKIGNEIKKYGIKKLLLLAGGGSIKANGTYDSAVQSLKNAGIEWFEHWGVRANPLLNHANKGIEIVKGNAIEAILAIGGGSVIDEAKSIAAGFYLAHLWDAFENKTPIDKALPVFTILTLSGTCSEMDPFAVLTNDENLNKWNISGNALYPKVSIVDPLVQMSLPWHQTVNGAIDAMSHVMEFYFMGKDEEITLSVNEALMRTIIHCVDLLQENPNNYSAWANLAWTATLGLNGISGVALHGGDWASHQIEHGISAVHPEIAHGAGLAVVFPAWIKYMNKHNPEIFKRWAKNVWNSASVGEAIEAMKNKYTKWDAPISLTALGIKEDEIVDIAANASRRGEAGALSKLNQNDIENILRIAS